MGSRLQLAKVLGTIACSCASLLVRAAEPPSTDQFITVPGCRIVFANAVELASERQGILAEIAAPGTQVASGHDVARLRDSVLKASMAIAERESTNDIEVRFAAKATELAELKYERALQANGQNIGTVSDLELKELRLAADRAALQFEQAEHRLAISRLRVDEIRASVDSLHVVAPFAARVRHAYKQPGEVVQEGEVLAELVSTDKVRVECDVELRDLPWVVPQRAVRLRLDGPSVPPELARLIFSGSITFVDVKVEPISHKVRIAAEFDNRGGQLREGLAATMLIPMSQPTDGQALTAGLPH